VSISIRPTAGFTAKSARRLNEIVVGVAVHRKEPSGLRELNARIVIGQRASVHLLHPNSSFVLREKFADQLSEIDSSLRFEEEGELMAIELVFRIQDCHRQRPLQHFLSYHLVRYDDLKIYK